MLRITRAEMDALQVAIGDPALLADLRAHFQKYDPKWAGSMSPEDLDHHLRLGIARARRWGIRTRDGIGVFIVGMQSAPQFDRHPPFRAMLSDPALDEPAKIAALSSRALLEEWRAARDLGLSWEDAD